MRYLTFVAIGFLFFLGSCNPLVEIGLLYEDCNMPQQVSTEFSNRKSILGCLVFFYENQSKSKPIFQTISIDENGALSSLNSQFKPQDFFLRLPPDARGQKGIVRVFLLSSATQKAIQTKYELFQQICGDMGDPQYDCFAEDPRCWMFVQPTFSSSSTQNISPVGKECKVCLERSCS